MAGHVPSMDIQHHHVATVPDQSKHEFHQVGAASSASVQRFCTSSSDSHLPGCNLPQNVVSGKDTSHRKQKGTSPLTSSGFINQ
eukprot:2775736-Amphidinium_carterae.1